jgi:iron complex transport system ATP-binding protein
MMAVHDLNLVSFFADKVALLVGGRLLRYGTPQEVIQEEPIRAAYQTKVDVIYHPKNGGPIIFPETVLK